MTASSAFPPASSDSLFASESPFASENQLRSPKQHRFIQLEKLSSFRKQLSGLMPILALCTALFGMACASIFVVIAEQELSPIATVFNRLLIATIGFGIWNLLQLLTRHPEIVQHEAILHTDTPILMVGSRDRSNSGSLILLTLAGVCFAASLSLSAWSLTQTSVANSALLNNMMPIFTTLGAWLFLEQRFSRKFLLGLLVAIVGVITIGIQDLHIMGNQMIGDAAALLAAILLAVTLLSLEQLRAKFSTATIMMGMSLTGSLAIAPLLLLSHSSPFPTSWTSGLAVLGLALVSQVIGHGLLTYSLKQFSSGLVSVSMLAIPMIATMLAMFLFSQPLSLLNGIAFLIVLLGIYLAISVPKCNQEFSSEADLPTTV